MFYYILHCVCELMFTYLCKGQRLHRGPERQRLSLFVLRSSAKKRKFIKTYTRKQSVLVAVLVNVGTLLLLVQYFTNVV